MAIKKYFTDESLSTLVSEIKEYADESVSTKADANHNHDTLYDSKGAADAAIATAKTYTDTEVAKKANVSHAHAISDITNLQTTLDGKASSSHNHDAAYAAKSHTHSDATQSASGLMSSTDKTKLDGIETGANKTTIDSSLSSTSTNPVQNKIINSALSGKVPTSRTVNGKALSSNITLSASDVGADASGSAASALASAKTYTDEKVAALVNGAPETLNTLDEIAAALDDNADIIDVLNSSIGNKADKTTLDSHTSNTTVHITSTERTNWNAAKTHADTAHAPSNAEKNQNAFSNVVVGSTIIAADTATDSLTLVGSNVTLTPDATNDKVTIGITKDNVVSALGYTPQTSGSYASASHTHDDRYYTETEIDTKLESKANSSHTHSDATTSAAGFMTAAMVTKLNGIATGATKVTVDSSLSSSSTNPVQNKVVNTAITNLTSTVSANTSSISAHTTAISNLQTAVNEFEEITSSEIQALFAA